MKPATQAIHSGFQSDPATGATATPIYQTASFAYASAQELADVFDNRAPGYVYTRMGNPTTHALERRLTELEGGVGCIATASGMSAIASVMMGLLRPGDEILSATGIFGGTLSLFQNTLGRFGVRTTLVDAADAELVGRAVSERTRVIFIETISNPRLDIPDFESLAGIARARRVPLVVDNTVTTPLLFNPSKVGASLVVHSTSKFINGHGTAIGGAIVDTGQYDWANGVFPELQKLARQSGQLAFLVHLRNLIHRDLGGCPAPSNSFLMLQGLETLAPRMTLHCDNALRLASFLHKHPDVGWVNYPGLGNSRFRDRASRYFGGRAGGLLTFGLGSRARAFAFIDALRLAKNLANLGDARTLVIHPSSTIFHDFAESEKKVMGIREDMVRVSVGIEDFEDIQGDFAQAIEKTSEE
jgi:O-acetylhomoserine (thiol)-lyase